MCLSALIIFYSEPCIFFQRQNSRYSELNNINKWCRLNNKHIFKYISRSHCIIIKWPSRCLHGHIESVLWTNNVYPVAFRHFWILPANSGENSQSSFYLEPCLACTWKESIIGISLRFFQFTLFNKF